MAATQQQKRPGIGATAMPIRADMKSALLVVGLASLLALSAQVKFFMPGNPVPVTLQTAAVLLCGFWLRPRLAVAAVAAYLATGWAVELTGVQLPFFAAWKAATGTATAGFLVGFLPAAACVSYISRRFRRIDFGRAAAVGLFGTAIIFVCGVTWLAWLTGSLESAIQFGFLPFAPWAAAKIAFVAALVQLAPPSWSRS